MPLVRTAEHPGVGSDGTPRPTEDRIFRLPNAVVLLDGATAPTLQAPSPVAYVDALGAALARGLPDELSLPDLLADAITTVADRDTTSATCTVAILRWNRSHIEALVLADSPIVLFGQSTEVIADDRLRRLRDAGALRTQDAVDRLRNVPCGFWVAGADPAAAHRAVLIRRPRATLRAAVLCSDGVSDGVDEYRLFDWDTALHTARRHGPHAVLAAVRAAERTDAERTRWPRRKVHDDQALALVEFPTEGPGDAESSMPAWQQSSSPRH